MKKNTKVPPRLSLSFDTICTFTHMNSYEESNELIIMYVHSKHNHDFFFEMQMQCACKIG